MTRNSPAPVWRLVAALAAGTSAFILVEGTFFLLAGPYEGWGFLGLLAAVPAALLALLRPFGRRFFFVLGLLFGLVLEIVMRPSGPDNPYTILPFLGFCVAGAAVLAEGVVRAIDIVSKRLGQPSREQS